MLDTMLSISSSPSNNPVRLSTVFSPILQIRKLKLSNFLKFLWQTVESDSGLPDSQLTPISQTGTVHISSGVLQASRHDMLEWKEFAVS